MKEAPNLELIQKLLTNLTIRSVQRKENNRCALFEKIGTEVQKYSHDFSSYKTIKGNTQQAERTYIEVIHNIIQNMGLTFEKAGSQGSKDIQNVGGIGLNIEVKKCDQGMNIFFNDTCPTRDIFYIVICTGKNYKKRTDIPGQIIFMRGDEFTKNSPWIQDYLQEIENIKNKYARGENAKKLEGCMSVYPRPTFRASILPFLNS